MCLIFPSIKIDNLTKWRIYVESVERRIELVVNYYASNPRNICSSAKGQLTKYVSYIFYSIGIVPLVLQVSVNWIVNSRHFDQLEKNRTTTRCTFDVNPTIQ